MARSISRLLRLMDRAIDLNHQIRLVAVKIDNKAIDNLLPTKVPPIEPICPQLLP